MITCQACGAQLTDDAKFCGICGAPVATTASTEPTDAPNPDLNAGAGQNQNPNAQGYPPYNQGYPPYGQNAYGYGAPYSPTPERPLQMGQFIYALINFAIAGIVALWPLMHVLNARKAPDDATEAYLIAKAKTANIATTIIGIVVTALIFVAELLPLILL